MKKKAEHSARRAIELFKDRRFAKRVVKSKKAYDRKREKRVAESILDPTDMSSPHYNTDTHSYKSSGNKEWDHVKRNTVLVRPKNPTEKERKALGGGQKRIMKHEYDPQKHEIVETESATPVNAMGASSTTQGPIQTYDPLLQIGKRKLKKYSMFKRKPV